MKAILSLNCVATTLVGCRVIVQWNHNRKKCWITNMGTLLEIYS